MAYDLFDTTEGWKGLNWRINYAHVDKKKHIGTVPCRDASIALGYHKRVCLSASQTPLPPSQQDERRVDRRRRWRTGRRARRGWEGCTNRRRGGRRHGCTGPTLQKSPSSQASLSSAIAQHIHAFKV